MPALYERGPSQGNGIVIASAADRRGRSGQAIQLFRRRFLAAALLAMAKALIFQRNDHLVGPDQAEVAADQLVGEVGVGPARIEQR